MRRIILLGSLLLLPGCQFAGNPFDGFGGFMGDTTTVNLNPNRPVGDSENLSRAMGQDVSPAPLLPEPGNVWPGPPRPDPTLQDIEREQNGGQPGLAPLPPLATPGQATPGMPVPGTPVVPHPQPRGSSLPPGSVQSRSPTPLTAPAPQPPTPLPPIAAPAAGVVQTPQGQAVITNTGNGVQQFTLPNGTTGRAISNGNGTVTLISPDGTVQSVPSPR